MPSHSDETAILSADDDSVAATGQSDPPLADGGIDPAFTDDLLHALAVALPAAEHQTDDQQRSRFAAAVSALRSFDAQQPVDAMIATHAILAHQFAMECYRRTARSSRTPNLDTRMLATAAMLSRTMNSMLQVLEQQPDEPVWVGPPAGNASQTR